MAWQRTLLMNEFVYTHLLSISNVRLPNKNRSRSIHEWNMRLSPVRTALWIVPDGFNIRLIMHCWPRQPIHIERYAHTHAYNTHSKFSPGFPDRVIANPTCCTRHMQFQQLLCSQSNFHVQCAVLTIRMIHARPASDIYVRLTQWTNHPSIRCHNKS